MRYYSDTNTLFIRGSFRAASTGISGGIRSVSTLLNHSLLPAGEVVVSEKDLDTIIAAAGLEKNYFGLTTAVPVHQACVFQFDFITVFITAGIRREPPATGGSINIIIVSSQGMEDAALLETIMVAAEAKAEALLANGPSADRYAGRCRNRSMRGGGEDRVTVLPDGARRPAGGYARRCSMGFPKRSGATTLP